MVDGTDREGLVGLLRDWSYAASRMTQGLETSASGAIGGDPESPPEDTGEALDLTASGLTITIGFGPGCSRRTGSTDTDLRPGGHPSWSVSHRSSATPSRRSGVTATCVSRSAPTIPRWPSMRCATYRAIAFGRAAIRWSQMGFGRTSKTTTTQVTPRNLMGFRDGTANILADDTAALDEHVWVPTGEPAWLSGGSYLVVRKIEMLIESWDRVRLAEQQTIIGRSKGPGAPLSGGDEFTTPDFEASADGAPVIDTAAHVRLAHPSSNGGVRILRRGYNYVDGNTPYGRLDAGLFFLAYQRSPSQFIALQRSLGPDLLNEYIRHIGSAIFAIPPGASARWLRRGDPVRLSGARAARGGRAARALVAGSARLLAHVWNITCYERPLNARSFVVWNITCSK